MKSDPFDFLEVEDVPVDECCKCADRPTVISVRIAGQAYAFCQEHEHRGTFLQRFQHAHWPALRIDGITGKYAIDSDPGAGILTAICGTDERIVELLDALDEYEAQQQIAS